METFLDLVNELKNRLFTSNYSNTFTTDYLKSKINEAYIWACQQYNFEELRKAKSTTTIANQQYYDYPADFITKSIFLVQVDGKYYKEKLFYDFIKMEEKDLSNDEYYFSEYGRQYFLLPIPKETGKTIIVWGYSQPAKLVNDAEKTIFYNFDLTGNEAIVRKAYSMVISPIDYRQAEAEEQKAKDILANIYQKQLIRKTNEQTIKATFIKVKDYFA